MMMRVIDEAIDFVGFYSLASCLASTRSSHQSTHICKTFTLAFTFTIAAFRLTSSSSASSALQKHVKQTKKLVFVPLIFPVCSTLSHSKTCFGCNLMTFFFNKPIQLSTIRTRKPRSAKLSLSPSSLVLFVRFTFALYELLQAKATTDRRKQNKKNKKRQTLLHYHD